MIDNVARHILGLNGWLALTLVFALPLLESSAFVGFVFPGEIAVVLGGVLASQHRVSLAAVLAAAIAGAILGDTVGYWVGHRYGRRLLTGRVNRLVRAEHRQRAERYLAERGGRAIFLGRFTAALRVMIPGLAGMARMPYRTFAAYNVAGGVCWATAMVFLGYLAGASWERAAHWASRVGLLLLGLILLVVALRIAMVATRRRADRFRAVADRVAATPPVVRLLAARRATLAWLRYRFPAETAWLGRRLEPTRADGLALSVVALLAALLAWTFAGFVEDVVDRGGTVRYDPGVTAFAVEHRTGALTAVMRDVTWLGSSWLLVPVLAVVTVLAARGVSQGRADWSAVVYPWAAYLGAVALYGLIKPLVGRPRPPSGELIGSASGFAFPSGHATQAVATWGMLALLLLAGRSARARAGLLAGAVGIALLVGASRVYLGAHWLTDVLAGYTLGACWLAVLVALRLRSYARNVQTVPEAHPVAHADRG